MKDESPRVSPLEDAFAFIEEQDKTYTVEALYEALIDAGYPSDIANEAIRVREDRSSTQMNHSTRPSHGSVGADQRLWAAAYLGLGAVLAWLACALFLMATGGEGMYGFVGVGLAILAAVMGFVLLLALVSAGTNEALRRGAEGALWAFLAIPLVVFFGLAGTCAVVMGGGG